MKIGNSNSRLSKLSKHRFLAVAICLLLLSSGMVGCTSAADIQASEKAAGEADESGSAAQTTQDTQSKKGTAMNEKTIILAGGCFWGTEKYFGLLRGVTATEVGYVNGTTDDPTYNDVTTGETGYAEAVKITYDDTLISLGFLLEMYFESIDPTAVNRQGNDVGTQYRSGIYYIEEQDKLTAVYMLAKLEATLGQPLGIECVRLGKYYTAEEYHQDYLDKNPNGYCHISQPDFDKAAAAVDPLRP